MVASILVMAVMVILLGFGLMGGFRSVLNPCPSARPGREKSLGKRGAELLGVSLMAASAAETI
jgi:hypothetical protein